MKKKLIFYGLIILTFNCCNIHKEIGFVVSDYFVSDGNLDTNTMVMEMKKGVILGEESIKLKNVELMTLEDRLIVHFQLTDFNNDDPLIGAKVFYGTLLHEDNKTLMFSIKAIETSDSTGSIKINSTCYENPYLICTFLGYATRIIEIIK